MRLENMILGQLKGESQAICGGLLVYSKAS